MIFEQNDEGVRLVLERRVRAPIDVVFAMLSDANELSEWLGPRDCTDSRLDGEVREGGRFVFRMRRANGDYAADGVFLELVKNERVAFTWRWFEAPADESLDTRETSVTFEVRSEGDFTIVTLTHARLPDEGSAGQHSAGWSDGLDKLEARIERLRQGDKQ